MAPKALEGDALEEWDRMIHRLEVSRALSTVDDAALYQYCRLFAETDALALSQVETNQTIALLEENLCGPKEERESHSKWRRRSQNSASWKRVTPRRCVKGVWPCARTSWSSG